MQGSRSDARADPSIPSAFSLPVRVYYEDTDAAGVVYYANYLRFFERARTEWLATLGHPVAELERIHAIVFVVRRVEVDYRRPARLSDVLDVSVSIEALRGASLTLKQRVMRGDDVLVDARVMLACVDRATLKPARIPIALGGPSKEAMP